MFDFFGKDFTTSNDNKEIIINDNEKDVDVSQTHVSENGWEYKKTKNGCQDKHKRNPFRPHGQSNVTIPNYMLEDSRILPKEFSETYAKERKYVLDNPKLTLMLKGLFLRFASGVKIGYNKAKNEAIYLDSILLQMFGKDVITKVKEIGSILKEEQKVRFENNSYVTPKQSLADIYYIDTMIALSENKPLSQVGSRGVGHFDMEQKLFTTFSLYFIAKNFPNYATKNGGVKQIFTFDSEDYYNLPKPQVNEVTKKEVDKIPVPSNCHVIEFNNKTYQIIKHSIRDKESHDEISLKKFYDNLGLNYENFYVSDKDIEEKTIRESIFNVEVSEEAKGVETANPETDKPETDKAKTKTDKK
jgi:hypothetical protein